MVFLSQTFFSFRVTSTMRALRESLGEKNSWVERNWPSVPGTGVMVMMPPGSVHTVSSSSPLSEKR